jgi:hypothetical protein
MLVVIVNTVSFQLHKKIFCYDLINPPAQDRKSNINLKLVNSNYMVLTKEEISFGTIYSVKVADPLKMGVYK